MHTVLWIIPWQYVLSWWKLLAVELPNWRSTEPLWQEFYFIRWNELGMYMLNCGPDAMLNVVSLWKSIYYRLCQVNLKRCDMTRFLCSTSHEKVTHTSWSEPQLHWRKEGGEGTISEKESDSHGTLLHMEYTQTRDLIDGGPILYFLRGQHSGTSKTTGID